MNRPMGVMKNDAAARDAWGDKAYSEIPKSVFALVAWHLANVHSGRADHDGAAEVEFLKEWQILAEGGHLPQRPPGWLLARFPIPAEETES